MNNQAAQNIYKLLKTLQAKHSELNKQANTLNQIVALPEIVAYDEQEANKRLSHAMVNDSVTGETTVDMVKAIIEKERSKVLQQSKELAMRKTIARSELSQIQTALNDIDAHIIEVKQYLDAEIKLFTLTQLEVAKQDYVNAADTMFEKLVNLYGLVSIFGQNASNAFLLNKVVIPKGECNSWDKHFGIADSFHVTSDGHNEKMHAARKQFLTELLGEENDYEITP